MFNKRYLIPIIAGVLVLAAAVTGAVAAVKGRLSSAEAEQAMVHGAYMALRERAQTLSVTVTENGEAVGVYDLASFGVLEDTLQAIDGAYTDTERMTPEAFAALSMREKLAWRDAPHTGQVEMSVVMDGFSAEAVLSGLLAIPRKTARDAYMSFHDGIYSLHAEQPGRELREDVVAQGLHEVVSVLVVTPDGADGVFEVTDCACYALPAVTLQNGGFDYDEALAEDLRGKRITVQFMNGTETLEGAALAALVSVGADGRLVVDRAALDGIVAAWAQVHDVLDTPYLFDSYVDGPVPIDFLSCDYLLRQGSLADAIEGQLLALESGSLTAGYDCLDQKGQPFGVTGTYIAVDIRNQHMVYYIDGELQVATDVVTGRVGGRETPTGLYSSYDRRGERWLIGSDYAVYVKYWVRFVGNYGLHDASWRDEFGGDLYIRDGSHGCVNTPDAAMAVIYEKIVDGTPVLVF